MSEKIVVDGSNVAFSEKSGSGDPRVSNLVAMESHLRSEGYEPLIFVDASLLHQVDDPEQLDALIDAQRLRQAPAGTEADYFLLETADRLGALVVSNDRFEKYQEKFSWLADRRVPFMIINGNVVLKR